MSKRTFQPSKEKEKTSMVLDLEWLQKTVEKFLMLVEEKVERKFLSPMSQDQKDRLRHQI